jgi:hypothetical protein
VGGLEIDETRESRMSISDGQLSRRRCAQSIWRDPSKRRPLDCVGRVPADKGQADTPYQLTGPSHDSCAQSAPRSVCQLGDGANSIAVAAKAIVPLKIRAMYESTKAIFAAARDDLGHTRSGSYAAPKSTSFKVSVRS